MIVQQPYPGDWEMKPGLVVTCVQAPMNFPDELLVEFYCPVVRDEKWRTLWFEDIEPIAEQVSLLTLP